MDAGDIEKHLGVLRRFTGTYCRRKGHARAPGSPLCPRCRELLDYAQGRLERCPFDSKPKCKNCQAPCYQKEYRERIKEIMRSSGKYYVMRGRLDWLIRYFLM